MPVIQWYRKLNLVARFTLTGLSLTVLVGFLAAGLVGQSLRQSTLELEAWNVSELVSQAIGPSLSPTDFHAATPGDRIAEIEQAERSLAGHSRIRDIRVWSAQGTLVYGRDHDMIGERYKPTLELERALRGEIASQPVLVQSVIAEELEQGIQTFSPIRDVNGAVVGAYETQHSIVAIAERLDESIRALWLSVTAGLALLYVGLFGIVKRASTELEWNHRELAELHSRREIDRMKTEFASTVSHELRAPLTSLIGYSELLVTRGPKDGPEHEWAELILRQSNRLSDLLDDILSASMIEDNAVPVSPRPLDLSSVISRAVTNLPSRANSLGIEIDLAPGLPSVLADREKVEQIVTNLLTNAVKYSPEGGEVRVTSSVVNGRLRLSVMDRGLGLGTEDLPRLFERFQRIHTKSHPEIGGTGLGLYISRSLAELQGGALWAESEGLGLGSTFHLELPLAPATESAATVVRRSLAVGASR